jgi:hypothetical protein
MVREKAPPVRSLSHRAELKYSVALSQLHVSRTPPAAVSPTLASLPSLPLASSSSSTLVCFLSLSLSRSRSRDDSASFVQSLIGLVDWLIARSKEPKRSGHFTHPLVELQAIHTDLSEFQRMQQVLIYQRNYAIHTLLTRQYLSFAELITNCIMRASRACSVQEITKYVEKVSALAVSL